MKNIICEKTSRKITWAMFLCSIIIVFRHSSGYKYFDMNENVMMDSIVKKIIDVITYDIFAVAMPTFFFFSGLLFFINFDFSKIKEKYYSRIKTLLIPYLAWNTLWMMFLAGIELFPFITEKIDSLLRFEFSLPNILNGIFLYKYNDIYWYMFQIIIYVLLCPIIYILLKNRYVGITCIFILYGSGILGIELPYINQEGILFYMIGAYIGLHFTSILEKNSGEKSILIGGIGVVSSIVILQWISIENASYTIITVLFMISAWLTLDILCKIEIKWWMKIYFFTYSFHRVTQQCINKIICILLPEKSIFAIVNWVLGAVITILISTLISWCLIRMCPHIWNILSGNRRPEIENGAV